MFVNLKEDLTDLVQKKLHYAKVNLTRLASSADGNMGYEYRLNEMEEQIRNIVIYESELNTIGAYFQDVPQPQQAVQQPMPQPQLQQNGPTHAE